MSPIKTGRGDIAFSEAVTVTLCDNEPGYRHYSVSAHKNFGIAGVTTGGFLNAAAVNACRQYINSVFGMQAYPDIIVSYIQFLSRVPSGLFSIRCHQMKASSAQCVIRVEIEPSAGDSGGTFVESAGRPTSSIAAFGVLTFGDISKETGITQSVIPVGLDNLPNFERESGPLDGPVPYEIMQKYRFRPRKSPGQLDGHGAGGHVRDGFYAMEPGHSMDTYSLTLFSDMGAQPPLTHELGLAESHAISTVSHLIEYKKRIPEGMEWVLVRTNTQICRNGRYDIDVFMLDLDGDIVAICRQVVQARSFKKAPVSRGSIAKI